MPRFADVGDVAPLGNAVRLVALGDDVGLAGFSAHQRRVAMRFLSVPADKRSAFQRSTNLSTCLGLRLCTCIFTKPISRSWLAMSVRMRSRLASSESSVPIAGKLLQFVVQVVHHVLGGSVSCGTTGVGSVGSVFLSVSPRLSGARFARDAGTPLPLVPVLYCWPPRRAVLGVEGVPGGEAAPSMCPRPRGSRGRRCGASRRPRSAGRGRAALRGSTTTTKGQGAHHLGDVTCASAT